jgi:hypothetical protein
VNAELIQWLRDQIAEKRQRAEAAAAHAPSPWKPGGSRLLSYANGRSEDMAVVTTYHDKETAPGYGWDRIFIKADRDQTIATHLAAAADPRAVIAECDAHTAILDLALSMREAWLIYPNVLVPGPFVGGKQMESKDASEHLLKAVALIYQHHPGYREEWR